jgi:hypothetical protein
MRLTRRTFVASVAAMPAVAGLERVAAAPVGEAVVLYDPALPQAAAFAADPRALAITGDRIRFARQVFDRRPALVRGVSRQGDRVLIEDVAREAGYVAHTTTVEGNVIDLVLVPRP